MRRIVFATGLLTALAATSGAAAAEFDFMAAPETDLNRVYRVDRATGEMGACQYVLGGSNLGATLCYPAGENAGPGAPSEYALVASRHARESGVFRVDMRTGAMSNCYVLDDKVVCTAFAK